MWLTKQDVVKGKYHYPKTDINLIPTKHVLLRMKQRGLDPSKIPNTVNVNIDNIHSAKTYDGICLQSVVIKIKFDDKRYLFLCFNPNDGGLKTTWFRSKERVEYENRRNTNDRSSG